MATKSKKAIKQSASPLGKRMQPADYKVKGRAERGVLKDVAKVPALAAPKPPAPPSEAAALERLADVFKGDAVTVTRKANLLKAMVRTLCIMTTALAGAHVTRKTYSLWRADDEVFAKAADELLEVQLDYVEGALFKRVQEGDTTAILFYLRTKGRARGYEDKSRLLPDGEGAPNFQAVNFVSVEELQREIPDESLTQAYEVMATILPPRPKSAKVPP